MATKLFSTQTQQQSVFNKIEAVSFVDSIWAYAHPNTNDGIGGA